MAYVITPRFTPVYQASRSHPWSSCGRTYQQPTYTYRVMRQQPRYPQYSSFNHFFGQVDELLSEIDREAQRHAQLEAQREAHRERQQRKRALRAEFSVNQDTQGWLIHGDIQGFDQDNISIEVTDEYTLKIAGNTRWQAEKAQPEEYQAVKQVTTSDAQSTTAEQSDHADSNTHPLKPMTAPTTVDSESDTESQKSYQATVEDDFEDLTAEASSLLSVSSTVSTESDTAAAAEPAEAKGEESTVLSNADPVPNVSPEDRRHEQERTHGSFERTFRFPERIDVARVSAQFSERILSIAVPKTQALGIRKIAIEK